MGVIKEADCCCGRVCKERRTYKSIQCIANHMDGLVLGEGCEAVSEALREIFEKAIQQEKKKRSKLT